MFIHIAAGGPLARYPLRDNALLEAEAVEDGDDILSGAKRVHERLLACLRSLASIWIIEVFILLAREVRNFVNQSRLFVDRRPFYS